MIDQQHHNVGRLDRLFGFHQPDVATLSQLLRQLILVRRRDKDIRMRLQRGHPTDDLDRRRLPDIVNVCFEGQAQAGNYRTADAAGSFPDLLHDMAGLAVIDFAGGPDQNGIPRVSGHNEPGVHSDTVPADAGSGLKDVDPRMMIGQTNELPDVNVQVFADDR